MADENKIYGPREILRALSKTLKEELKKYEKGTEPKTFTPREIAQELAKTLQSEIDKHKEKLDKSSADEAEDDASKPVESPVKPTERRLPQYGCELTHVDAVEHHAFHAASRFHEGRDEVAMDHLVLAKAHAQVADLDAKPMIDLAYSLTEEIEEPISDVFGPVMVSHPMDKELVKALKEKRATKKGLGPAIGANAAMALSEKYPKDAPDEVKDPKGKPSSEEVKIASGEGVDKEHVGKTPDDYPKPPDNSHAEDAKVKTKKKEDEDDEDEDEKDKDKEKMKKDFVSPDVKDIKEKKGYRKLAAPKAPKAAKSEEELDGKGKGSGCNSVMTKKGKK